jgi:hypothetical protein
MPRLPKIFEKQDPPEIRRMKQIAYQTGYNTAIKRMHRQVKELVETIKKMGEKENA